MQDEINSRMVAISINLGRDGARLTSQLLRDAIRQFLNEQDRAKTNRKNAKTIQKSKTYRGKQTVAKLMEQNTKLTSIEVTDKNIKSFEKIAKKYNIDFALKKDKSKEPPRYIVFFKARDAEVMEAAFRDYSGKSLKRERRESVRDKLHKAQEKARQQNRQRQHDRTRNRHKERSRQR